MGELRDLDIEEIDALCENDRRDRYSVSADSVACRCSAKEGHRRRRRRSRRRRGCFQLIEDWEEK